MHAAFRRWVMAVGHWLDVLSSWNAMVKAPESVERNRKGTLTGFVKIAKQANAKFTNDDNMIDPKRDRQKYLKYLSIEEHKGSNPEKRRAHAKDFIDALKKKNTLPRRASEKLLKLCGVLMRG
jgi:hypothetical protein